MALTIAALWAIVAYEVLVRAGAVGGGAFGANYGVNWSVLQAPSPVWVFPQAVLHPSLAFQALSFDIDGKLLYLLLLFGPVAFLPWIGEDSTLFPVLAWVGLALLSNNPAYYSLGDEYAAYALPFLMVGLVDGLIHARPAWRRLRVWASVTCKAHARGSARPPVRSTAAWGSVRARTIARGVQRLLKEERPLAGALLALGVAGALAASPLLPNPAGSFTEITYGIPTETSHDLLLHRVIGLIPPNAAVLTTTTLFPEISGRNDAFVLPTSSYFLGNSTFAGATNGYVNSSQFVLVDYRVDPYSAVILAAYVNLSGFGLYAAANGAYLYERGWVGPPVLQVPWSPVEIPPSSLVLGDAFIDPLAGGSPLHHPPGEQGGSELWSGPGLYPVPPGTYQVTLDLRVSGPTAGRALLADLVRVPITVSEELVNPSLTGHDYGFAEDANTLESELLNVSAISPGAGHGWENVTLTGTWPKVGVLDCEGWLGGSNADIWLYGIEVAQISPETTLG